MTEEEFELVTTRQPRTSTFLTGMEGIVRIEGGCFTVDGVAIIFPKGSATWAEDRKSVLYDGAPYEPGTHASFTGAGIPLDLVPDVVLPQGCDGHPAYFLASP